MLSVDGKRYEYEMNVLVNCARRKIPIVEVPVQTIYHDRDNSCSHFWKIRDSFRIYRQLLKFSAASLSSFVLGLWLVCIAHCVVSGRSSRRGGGERGGESSQRRL